VSDVPVFWGMLFYPGMFSIQGCFLSRDVFYPGMFSIQYCVSVIVCLRFMHVYCSEFRLVMSMHLSFGAKRKTIIS